MVHLDASWGERTGRMRGRAEDHEVDERALRELALDLLGDAAHDRATWMATPKKHQGHYRVSLDESQMSGAATHSYGSPMQSQGGSGQASPMGRNFTTSPVASRPQSAEPSSRRPTSAQHRGSGIDSRPLSATRRSVGMASSPLQRGQHQQQQLYNRQGGIGSSTGKGMMAHAPYFGGGNPEQLAHNTAHERRRRRRNRPASAPPTPMKLFGGVCGEGELQHAFAADEGLSPAHDRTISSLKLVHPDRDTLRSTKAKAVKWIPCRKTAERRRRVKDVTPGPGHYENNWIPNPINFPIGPFTRVLAYTEPRLKPSQKEKELAMVPSPQDYHVSRAAGSDSASMRAFSKKKASPAAFFGSSERVEIVFNKADMGTFFY